ncbi:hypothetical protein GPJ56_003451 [Histomonas meleagridis]|uniref:uncharacterized protein n=1 Tax=Histomonas meleagridis TaxID=135588 RepID=UPI0035595E63|nr:hypothetical protein GPJ56_003451 [Histomonas meleagridis]KAH0799143.1 hypothetical protein GO595_007940 [Histomonas meleagridis]
MSEHTEIVLEPQRQTFKEEGPTEVNTIETTNDDGTKKRITQITSSSREVDTTTDVKITKVKRSAEAVYKEADIDITKTIISAKKFFVYPYSGDFISIESFDAKGTSPKVAFNKIIDDEQTFQAKKLSTKVPPKGKRAQILEKVMAVKELLGDDDTDLKSSLQNAVNTDDQIMLVPLQSEILASFKKHYAENPKSRLVSLLTETLIYTSHFCEVSKYSPRDVSLECKNVIQHLGDKLDKDTISLLSEMSELTQADSVERSLIMSYVQLLRPIDQIEVQVLRYISSNIEDSYLIDGKTDQQIRVKRYLEHGSEFPKKKKPLKPIDIKEQFSICKRAFNKLHDIIEKDGKEPHKEYSKFFKEAAHLFEDIEKYYSYPKVIQNSTNYITYEETLEKALPIIQDLSKDAKTYAQRSIESLKILIRLVSYTQDNVITINSAFQSLTNARTQLEKDIQESDDPDFIHRMAAISASILKLNTMIIHPLLQDSNIQSIQKSITTLQQDLESRTISNEFQIAHWLLGAPRLIQATLIIKLKDISIEMKETSDLINSNKANYSTNDVKQASDQWINFLNRNSDIINSMSADIEPDKATNATELIQIRSSFGTLLTRIDGLGIEQNVEKITNDIEMVISMIQKENYYHKAKYDDKRAKEEKAKSSKSMTGHVSFTTDKDKKDGTDKPTDEIIQHEMNTNLYPRFYPQTIRHPIYESWDPETFKDIIHVTKSVPIDMQMLSKVTTVKLSRHRTTSKVINLLFNSYILEDSKSVSRNKVEKPEDPKKQKEEFEKIKNEFDDVRSEPMNEQYDFIERSVPILNDMYLNDDKEFAEKYDNLISRINDMIVELGTEKRFMLPRKAVTRLSIRFEALLGILNTYKDIDEIKNDEKTLSSIENWIEYINELLRCNKIIQNADDEVAIVGAKSFYYTYRSGISSFTQNAELFDQKAKRRSAVNLTKLILQLTEIIIKFNQLITFTELCSVEDAQKQLQELEEEFNKNDEVKEIFTSKSALMKQQLSSPNINSSIADNIAQQLSSIHQSLESNIKNEDDNEYNLFIMTIGVRLSIMNLHVSDGDIDSELSELSEITINDFNNLITFIQKEINDSPKGVLATKWVQYLKECLHDIEGIHSNSDIALNSPTRYSIMMYNLIDISQSLSILENKKFPISNTPYSRLSLHLDKLIDYTRAHRSTTDSRKKRSTALPSLLQEQLLSTKLTTDFTTSASHFDEMFSPFSDGFLPNNNNLQSQIQDNLAQKISMKDDLIYSIIQLLSRLFSTHSDILSRNYNIGLTSTRVTSELLISFCKSIIECTDEAIKSLETKDIKQLEEKIKLHINTIQQIQNKYDDKTVYSNFGRLRIVIFSRYCMVISQLTKLNIYHITNQENQFDFDEAQVQFRSIRQSFTTIERNFNQTLVEESFNQIEVVSRSMIEEDTSLFTSLELLQTESKYCQNLQELVSLLNAENDARLWKSRDIDLKLTEMEYIKPIKEGDKIAADDLKKSVEIVYNSLITFRSTLQNNEVEVTTVITLMNSLDEVTNVFYKDAMNVEGEECFYNLVTKFRQEIIIIINYIKQQLIIGTNNLCSDEVNIMLRSIINLSLRIIKQLDLMQQLEEPKLNLSDFLSNLIKLLLLTRDDLYNASSKLSIQTIEEFIKYIGGSFEVVANSLLVIKNSNQRILTKILTEKIKILRRIVFATQKFLFKANFEPLVKELVEFKKAIPKIIPAANTMIRLMTTLIVKMNIIIEPHFEERPLLSL